jgi:vacuolar-type H+-ATPase subunit E/Vma4
MGQENLDTQLIQKTLDQRNKILNDAKADAEKIMTNAEMERRRIIEQNNNAIVSVIGSELRAVNDRIVGQAELEGRKLTLEARYEILEKVKEQAYEEIRLVASRKHPDYNYDEILTNLLLEAVEMIDDDHYLISANSMDIGYLEKNIDKIEKRFEKKIFQLKKNPLDIIGGVFVSNLNGKKTMENTLEIRLETASQKLQSEIAKYLGVI